MDVRDRVEAYLAGLPEPKQAEADLRRLHALVGAEFAGRLWSTGGRNEAGRVVANPNIGCGENTTRYADGSSRVFYRIGLSATTSGISVYLLGLDDDKAFLARTYGPSIGRATVTGYCIRFRRLTDIDADTLLTALPHAMAAETPG